MNYKLSIISLIVFLVGTTLTAQVRFSKSYDMAEYSDSGQEMFLVEDQIITSTIGFCDYPTLTPCGGLLSTNMAGNELWKTSFDTLTYFYKNNFRVVGNTLYSLVGFVEESETIYRLLSHDLSGNLLGNRLINVDIPQYRIPYFNKIENGWLLNISEEVGGKWQNYLVWLNEFLSPIDIKSYTDTDESFQSFDILELDDGGFLISGSYQTVSWPQEHALIRLDSTANVIWDRRLPPPYSSAIGRLIESNDGNFIVTYPTEDFETDDDWYPPTIQKVDPEGNVLWRHIFYSTWPRNIGRIILANNDDIIGVGDQLDAAGSDLGGWIFRISQEGELIWDRAIAENKYGGGVSFTEGVLELPNEDLMFCGVLIDTLQMPDIPQARVNTWLVRTGPDGCLISDPEFCNEVAYTTSTDDLENSSITPYDIYPNPVTNNLYLKTQSDGVVSVALNIYNVNGQLVKQIEKINTFPHELPVEDLNAGFYLVKLIDHKGTITTLKMIKQ